MKSAKLGVPDLVSNSYFAALAAVKLGFFSECGYDVALKLVYPSDRTFEGLRDGSLDLVAAPAHSTFAAFPDFHGAKLLASLGQGTYWLLIMNEKLGIQEGDLKALRGLRIGAAPLVELTLRQLLADEGYDLERDGISIVAVPGAQAPGVSFGIAAARALQAGVIDGFWANGLGAEVAIRAGVGRIVLDVRRGLGPPAAFHYTFPALVTSDRLIASDPDLAVAGAKAIAAAHRALRDNVSLAKGVADELFPCTEAAMTVDVVARDLPYYRPHVPLEAIEGLSRFCVAQKIAPKAVAYEQAVATQCAPFWG